MIGFEIRYLSLVQLPEGLTWLVALSNQASSRNLEGSTAMTPSDTYLFGNLSYLWYQEQRALSYCSNTRHQLDSNRPETRSKFGIGWLNSGSYSTRVAQWCPSCALWFPTRVHLNNGRVDGGGEAAKRSMADFDFAVYLQRVYPHHRYHVQPLAGGLVNYTVRARREAANEGLEPSEDHDEAPSVMVLKQAPPFVAALGAEAPFSQQRQVSIYRPFACVSAGQLPADRKSGMSSWSRLRSSANSGATGPLRISAAFAFPVC